MKILTLLLAVLIPVAPALAAEKPKPNVLFILADDMRGDIGAFSNPVVKTPALDRLAARGVSFQRAYCQLPWCNPSRTSILSGLRPDATRVLGNGTLPDAHLRGTAVFLPEHFKASGYWTARAGKIFHDSPAFQGWVNAPRFWDVSVRGQSAWPKTIAAHRVLHGRGTREDFVQYTVFDAPEEQTPEYRLATRGIELIEQGAKQSKPFYVAVGFHKPHLAWQMPKKYWDLYDPTKIPLLPEPPLAEQKIPQGAGGGGGKREAPMPDADRREAIAAYYACISYIDAQIGRLLGALEKNGLAENTVVVFAGDHGYNLGEHHGAWEKVKLWEDTCRAPLLIAAPGFKPGASERIVEFIDIFPTLTDLCGLPAPKQKLEGVSLRPLLANPDAAWDRPAFTIVPVGNKSDGPDAQVRGRSVRTERWRYTEFGPGAAQLFDHDADPHEFKNLAADPAHAATVTELSKLLRDQAAADAAALP